MSIDTANAAHAPLLSVDELLRLPKTLVIAHRGLPEAAPENSLPGFAAALDHKPDFVELDYRHSSDGVLTVIHDEKLDRTTNSRTRFGQDGTPIGRKTAAELRELDAGTWFSPKFAGTRLPTLSEAIDLVCPKAGLMIERKDGDAAALVKLLNEKKVLDRVIVQAFDWSFIAEVRKLEPNLPTGLLGERELDAEKLAKIREIAPRVIGWNQRDLDAAGIRAAHELGVKVWSWTVNEPARARELVAAGLDGLITNRADAARAWLAEK
ncbi:MAG: glycerophosphodiester phosphodiesterase [Planctomycetia bacterium]|nr:glycerophosphodiester phosphodiesterase [Planctomycetia bacterium]